MCVSVGNELEVLKEMINEVVTKANHNMSSQMIYTLKSF